MTNNNQIEYVDVGANSFIQPFVPLHHKSIEEIREGEEFRKQFLKTLQKGDFGKGADYGNAGGVDGMVFKWVIAKIQDAYYMGTGDPVMDEKEITIDVNGKKIVHFRITAKVPLYNLRNNQIIGVGVGGCSSLEAKYRYRGSDRKCPKCGQETIVKGLEEYGGGWICYRKKGGCGAKFKDDDSAITNQPVGKIENVNPYDVYDTVLDMAIKRAELKVTLKKSGMDKYLRMPDELADDGDIYHANNASEKPKKSDKYNQKPPAQTANGNGKNNGQQKVELQKKQYSEEEKEEWKAQKPTEDEINKAWDNWLAECDGKEQRLFEILQELDFKGKENIASRKQLFWYTQQIKNKLNLGG